MTRRSFRANLIKLHRSKKTWPEIAAMYPGVSLGTITRIANDRHYWPKSPDVLRKLVGTKPRRKYDLTTREAREIGIGILKILYDDLTASPSRIRLW